MNEKFITLSLVLVSAATGCGGGPSPETSVIFVDRVGAYAPGQSQTLSDPQTLLVDLNNDGRLSLNKIETGTIEEPKVLAAKIKAIFDDRQKSSISEREVLIEMNGEVKFTDLNRLIEELSAIDASPIHVMKK